MLVARSFDTLSLDRPALLTIGTFDGVHRGHRFLLEQAAQRAAEHGYGLMITTFDPSPAVVLRPSLGRYQLTSADQKIRSLAAMQPHMILLLQFDQQLAALSAAEFMANIEARIDLRELWMGEDFHFGRDRGGGLAMLVERGRESGFALHVVARRMEDHASISSTRVRAALKSGDVAGAMPLLGFPFAREIMTHSRIEPDGAACYDIAPHLVLPAEGLYATLVSAMCGGESMPTVTLVRPDADQGQLAIWPAPEDGALQQVEFIARLEDAADRRSRDEQLHDARAVLDQWHRPIYPASGRY